MSRLDALQLVAGPQVAGRKLYHNDKQCLLIMNGRILPLTPTEYLLSMTLFRQRERWERTNGQAPFCASLPHLQAATGIQQRSLLAKHVSNASCKLAPLGMRFVSVGDGYVLLFENDLSASEEEAVYART